MPTFSRQGRPNPERDHERNMLPVEYHGEFNMFVDRKGLTPAEARRIIQNDIAVVERRRARNAA